MNQSKGFTLVELMVTIAVFAVIAAMAIPSFNELTRRSRLSSSANQIVSALQLARAEAVGRRSTVQVCPSVDGSVCAGALGRRWIVRSTKNGASTVMRDVRLNDSIQLASSQNLAGGANAFTFTPNGFSATGAQRSGTVSLCVTDLSGENAVDVSANIGRVSSARRSATPVCTAPTDN